MFAKKVNRLLKIHKKFWLIPVISSAIYVSLYLVLLLLSGPYPVLTFLVLVSVVPGTIVFINLPLKINRRLINNINTELTKIIKQEFQKEFDAQNIDCMFYIKPIGNQYNTRHIVREFYIYYSDPDVKLYRTVLFTIAKIQKSINTHLPSLHHIDIFPNDDPSCQSDVIV